MDSIGNALRIVRMERIDEFVIDDFMSLWRIQLFPHIENGNEKRGLSRMPSIDLNAVIYARR